MSRSINGGPNTAHGCLADEAFSEAFEGVGGRESSPEEDVYRGTAQSGDRPGSTDKKVVKPSQRKEMARKAELGIWPVLPVLAQSPQVPLESQASLPGIPGTELNLRIKPRKCLIRDKPQPL